MSEQLIEELLVEVLDGVHSGATLILYNDDVNTFDHVIDCLVRICKHDELQAEQVRCETRREGRFNGYVSGLAG
jgi:ATP-dependent Clp protease adaptor protein ClpS